MQNYVHPEAEYDNKNTEEGLGLDTVTVRNTGLNAKEAVWLISLH